ncbi:microtubule-associated serine/threonine-protein kinase 3-like [Anomaloglossus baeobatrachus]
MYRFFKRKPQVAALSGILDTYSRDSELLPPDGILSFTYQLVLELVKDCLTKYQRGDPTSKYLNDVCKNIRTLLQQAQIRSQNGDLGFFNELAQEVLSVLEGPARPPRHQITAKGDSRRGQNINTKIPDPKGSQRELNSHLITEKTELSTPDSGICEIPEIHESASNVIATRARTPSKSDYEMSILIGKGAFGAVNLVRHKDSKKIFAMKKLDKKELNTPSKMQQAFLERDILTFADCPFVVSMLCSFPTKSHLCMVMEYVEGGDCGNLLRTMKVLPISLARLYFAEAMLAVEYLHSYGVVHRDLKPDNLLITSAGHIKVSDFGLSKFGLMMPKTNIYQESPENIAREFRDREMWGTIYYMAPEVILLKGFGRPVDWWSMGIILYEFLVGNIPFHDKDTQELYKKIVRGDISFKCFPALPLNAQNLITKLLRRNPVERLGTGGADEIKCQPFLEDLDFENLLSQEPEYVPQRSSDVYSCLSDNDSDIYQPMGSEDKDKRREDNENREFQNFTSSSERLSKLCTSVIRTMSKEDPKSPPESSEESNTKSSEMQKESPPVSDGDDAVSSGISSFPFSGMYTSTEPKMWMFTSRLR